MIFTSAQDVHGTRIQWIDMAKGYGITPILKLKTSEAFNIAQNLTLTIGFGIFFKQ